MCRRLLPLATVLALGLVALAVAAPSGSYKGKIAYQGYAITFKVKGAKVTNLVARMLVDCDRDGYPDTGQFLIAPRSSFPIARGKVAKTVKERVGHAVAVVRLEGAFSGGSFKGYVREYDTVDGNGVVCDTLKRKFTAKKR